MKISTGFFSKNKRTKEYKIMNDLKIQLLELQLISTKNEDTIVRTKNKIKELNNGK